MKKAILFLILVGSFTAHAQSLKDLLYGGKLKKDSNTVIRKGDDLSSKIDTSTKKPAEPEKAKITAAVPGDSSVARPGDSPASVVTVDAGNTTNTAAITTALKDNNKIWKEYIDSLAVTFKTELLPSKKIKEGSYYLLIEYEIGPDGQTSINSVSCSPESSFLQQQVKERLTLTSPQMIPVVTNGKARKVVKKYNMTIAKM